MMAESLEIFTESEVGMLPAIALVSGLCREIGVHEALRPRPPHERLPQGRVIAILSLVAGCLKKGISFRQD